eukprot:CAMPEP_0172509800 /NCGR_PEP_ID=MMETSP1066-20121228/223244_1 /TAXON_ID=671091 /ORGANISM="Coscinodiscus wailesii, Strain CCMP2513" /LENGTH=153 /DNA_ID=CAMNT_0013288463 /DNA_START=88 /DNA_END=546 /DNA_ORIENTATION=-
MSSNDNDDGRIRVFCRLRPNAPSDDDNDDIRHERRRRRGRHQLDDNDNDNDGRRRQSVTNSFLTPEDDAEENDCVTDFSPDGSVTYSRDDGGGGGATEKTFRFRGCFGPSVTQAEVYDACVSDIVKGVCDGYNGTVLAYGRTGGGKTYTMRGP